MSIFGTTEEEAREEAINFTAAYVLHTAIDAIRYGDKSAGFLTEMPIIEASRVAKLAYSVIIRFEDNFCESYQDDQGTWQKRGKGVNALTTPLYNRLHAQAEAALPYVNQVFKTPGYLTVDKVQQVLDFVQKDGVYPVMNTDGIKFSELDNGLKDYISFQTNVAIGRCIKIFKATGVKNLKKSMISAQVIDDLVELEIFEKGQMPVAATPAEGEIMTFATDETDTEFNGQIEVEVSDLYPLQSAQKHLMLWWNMFDRTSDKRNLTDIMVTEAREFLAEKQANPTQAGYVLAQ
jgi:hypothetical protein